MTISIGLFGHMWAALLPTPPPKGLSSKDFISTAVFLYQWLRITINPISVPTSAKHLPKTRYVAVTNYPSDSLQSLRHNVYTQTNV